MLIFLSCTGLMEIETCCWSGRHKTQLKCMRYYMCLPPHIKQVYLCIPKIEHLIMVFIIENNHYLAWINGNEIEISILCQSYALSLMLLQSNKLHQLSNHLITKNEYELLKWLRNLNEINGNSQSQRIYKDYEYYVKIMMMRMLMLPIDRKILC